jgi:hypothetical protein
MSFLSDVAEVARLWGQCQLHRAERSFQELQVESELCYKLLQIFSRLHDSPGIREATEAIKKADVASLHVVKHSAEAKRLTAFLSGARVAG